MADDVALTYPHLRDVRAWTLPRVLQTQAERCGDKLFVQAVDGGAMSYADAFDAAARMAGYLRSLGVEQGDHVAVLLPNSLDFIRVWLGVAHLGATLVPLNHALTGPFLAHQLTVAGAKTVICHADYAQALSAVRPDVPGVRVVVRAGPAAADQDPSGPALETWSEALPVEPVSVDPRDIACVMFTSGTTGPSKGVTMPHGHCYLLGLGIVDNLHLTQADRYYVTMPLYHANALFMQMYSTLIAGASAVLRPRFSPSGWLPDIRKHDCTVTNLLGAMSQFITDQPPAANDRQHGLRAVVPAPNPPAHEKAWRDRFGISDVVSAYGMTEANVPLYGRMGESHPGTAGFAYGPYFEVRISDPETDVTVPPGVPGEICVRSTVPGGFSTGYLGLPGESMRAFRDFWFHTGDLCVMDADGCVRFIDRQNDCIRRRGENISSFEVEAAIIAHPAVREVAAFAVPTGIEGTENEVMLVVVPAQDGLTPTAVAEFADEVLPKFARPRFVEIVPELPKTPTERVQKARLRQRGVTAATWDRERDRTPRGVRVAVEAG